MQHLWIKDIKENAKIEGNYLVKNKSIGQTRQGNSFLTLTLGDKTGTIEAKVWDRVDEISTKFKEGNIVTIAGQANTYRNQIQIQIHKLQQNKSPVDPTIFQESTPKDITHMLLDLKTLANKIQNRHLRTLIDSFMADHHFVTQLKKAPAAKNFHHSYLGGLLEHTLSVSQMAVLVSPNIQYSNKGRLLGHIVLGVMMVEEKLKSLKDFPPELALRLKHPEPSW